MGTDQHPSWGSGHTPSALVNRVPDYLIVYDDKVVFGFENYAAVALHLGLVWSPKRTADW